MFSIDLHTHISTTSTRRFPSVQVLFGDLVVVLGVSLLLDTTVVFPTSAPLLCAPSLSVVVGVWVLFQSRLQNIVGAAVFITIGAVWQAVALDFATVHRISSLPASSGRTDPPGSLRSA
ncbi:hypothetical protein ACFQE8_22315 [Salinirubellus sp. GCM10025818]|uniref:LiaF transmembrane domain-containing protein n=1 Tax=Salinirubellus TaxID=2162630 RepID=UPI003618C518